MGADKSFVMLDTTERREIVQDGLGQSGWLFKGKALKNLTGKTIAWEKLPTQDKEGEGNSAFLGVG